MEMTAFSICWNNAKAANRKNIARLIAQQAHCQAIIDHNECPTIRSEIWVDVWAKRLEQSTKEAA